MAAPTLPPVEILAALAQAWGSALQPAGCPACKRAFLTPAAGVGRRCPACSRANLEPQSVRIRPEAPEKIVSFRLLPKDLLPGLTRFAEGVWIRPDDLDGAKLASRVVPVFWPVWLVDAAVDGAWTAEVGFDYQVKSSQESYASGGWRSREIVETRARWEPRLGQIRRRYDNIPAAAVTDAETLLNRAGRYQLQDAAPYQPAAVGGALLRVPDLPPESAWPAARQGIDAAAALECQQASAGQHIRNFSPDARYEDQNWTQLLLPVYLTYYTDDAGQPVIVQINGQTGVVGGPRLASQKKGWRTAGLLAALGAFLVILGIALVFTGGVFPLLALLGALVFLGGIVSGLSAVVPAVWPWQWNRKQRGRS
jgi:hypothetical protein